MNAAGSSTARTAHAQPRWDIRTFGRAEVLVDGAPANWASQGAQDLFFYLLSHPEGRSREEILEALWGLEADASSGNRFRVTLHRLRAALGDREAVGEAYGRYHLSPALFRASDVQALHAALHEADSAQDAAQRLRAYQRALSTYHGDYLPQLRSDWAQTAREEHQAAYVRACTELSLVYCEQRDCPAAVGALVRALKADPYIGEQYHQKLMTCLSVVESKYAAVEHYRRFIRFLRDHLADTPMAETAELAGRIKCGEQICARAPGPSAAQDSSCALRASRLN
ncbi:response regulator receiver protein [Deinococcus irradiatisoli]|uniref:Response regulator receiver protein n=1 Tax=Deinococcus irradiatisoli TaxID=2202254 RepID=A0A2Z3JGM3_9DEIO|nr:BTAD domain-containing putative transcriptional regulator [Deinococcus irradiatisoli]AWN24313.1 response regulator receiver protein [Deinococcus irradiatisoli]